MADDDQEVQLAAKLPFSERVAHKNWKVRAEAYTDIKAVCERAAGEDDPALAELGAPLHMRTPPAAPCAAMPSCATRCAQGRCCSRRLATRMRQPWTRGSTLC